jgi:hypothetical protein
MRPMKTLLSLGTVLFSLHSACVGQVTVTSLDRTGFLTWSNRLCIRQPVYEVLRSTSITGAWEHVVFVTNQTSVALPNFPGDASATFYRLAFVSHDPIVFDYVFDEGYGFPAVIGEFTLSFTGPGVGVWAFERTDFSIDDIHPVGNGQFSRGLLVGNTLTLHLQQIFDGGYYLEGQLTTEQGANGCSYDSYFGGVYEQTFAGEGESIGTFLATAR